MDVFVDIEILMFFGRDCIIIIVKLIECFFEFFYFKCVIKNFSI